MSQSSPPKNIIVLGAASAIGEATCRLFAAGGARLVLAGRDEARLGEIAADLRARGADCCIVRGLDLAATQAVRETFAQMLETLGGHVDCVLLFYGTLGDQRAAETDPAALEEMLRINFTSAAQWCMAAAETLERQDAGVLAAVGSVAGDRGRQSNYAYGAAKAGLSVLMQGIAHRLARGGARAVIIKPGFVDTPMTAHIDKGGPLWARPERIGAIIKDAVERDRGPVVYAPWFWRWIMCVIRALPSTILHRTRL